MSTTGPSTPSAPSACPSTSAATEMPAYVAAAARPAAPRRAAAQPRHRLERRARRPGTRLLHPALRLPGRRDDQPGRDGRCAGGRRGLEVLDVEALRRHYALTLRAWVRRLEANWDEAVASRARAGRGCGGCTWPQVRAGLRVRRADGVEPGPAAAARRRATAAAPRLDAQPPAPGRSGRDRALPALAWAVRRARLRRNPRTKDVDACPTAR